MSLDLPLVRGDVDPSVALRESAAPVALVHAGEADAIVVDPAGFVLLDEAGARPSDTPTLRRLAGDEAARAAEGTTASFIPENPGLTRYSTGSSMWMGAASMPGF